MAVMILPLSSLSGFYPYFKWHLFRASAKVITQPIVYIAQANDHVYSPPISYHEYFTKVDPNRSPGKTTKAHEDLWGYLSAPDEKSRTLVRKNLESFLFSKFNHVQYSIRVTEIDKIEYFNDFSVRRILSESESFHFGEK